MVTVVEQVTVISITVNLKVILSHIINNNMFLVIINDETINILNVNKFTFCDCYYNIKKKRKFFKM